MIPKKIHYCWFGGNALSIEAKGCIETWKEYLPEYEIIQWNEQNFDVNCNVYVKEAYENKKWAFVTDYVRLYALYTIGGIYMDTDVEVLKPLDVFLNDKGFSGFENERSVPTGIMGAEKGNLLIKKLLDGYNNRHFLINGEMDLSTNVEAITDYCVSRGLLLNNSLQEIDEFKFYPKDYFCPKNSQTLELNLTPNSYTIHHFAGSWTESTTKWKLKLKKILGPRLCEIILKYILKDEKYK